MIIWWSTVYKCDANIFLKNLTQDVSFRKWNEVPYFKQGGEEKVFWFEQDGSTPLPKLPFRVPPLPHHPLPQGIYFNITRPNILYAVIKFWLWQNDNSKWLTKACNNLIHGSLTSGTHTSWNLNWLVAVTYIIKSRPISVKTKSSFPLVTYYYCFSTRAVALPGWWYSHSPNNNPTLPPPPARPSKDIQQQQHLLFLLL